MKKRKELCRISMQFSVIIFLDDLDVGCSLIQQQCSFPGCGVIIVERQQDFMSGTTQDMIKAAESSGFADAQKVKEHWQSVHGMSVSKQPVAQA